MREGERVRVRESVEGREGKMRGVEVFGAGGWEYRKNVFSDCHHNIITSATLNLIPAEMKLYSSGISRVY